MRLFSRVQVAIRNVKPSGVKADVVVFDAKTVKAPATRTQPKQFPIEIDYVIVNGQVVVIPRPRLGAVDRLEQHVIHERGSIAV